MKKNVPISIINQIESALKDVSHLIGVYYEEGSILVLREKNDPDSPFYYKITGISSQDPRTTVYSISYLPSHDDHLKSKDVSMISSSLIENVQVWVGRVMRFNSESKIFDDPILQRYYEDLETKFTVTDDDADSAPHPNEVQGKLYDLYDQIKHLIESEKRDDNTDEAEHLIKQIESAQRKISKQTKREATKNLQKVMALVSKYSYQITKLITDGLMIASALKLITGG